MKSIEQMAWEAEQLGMSYGQYVALCESEGGVRRELERRGAAMPDYKSFRARAAAKKRKRAAQPKKTPQPLRIRENRPQTEYVRRCAVCGIRFKTVDAARKYCGIKCAVDARNRQWRERYAERRERERC